MDRSQRLAFVKTIMNTRILKAMAMSTGFCENSNEHEDSQSNGNVLAIKVTVNFSNDP